MNFRNYSILRALLLLLALNGSVGDNSRYDVQIGVAGLCGDTPDAGLSFAFKTVIETAVAGFYESVHQNDGFTVSSVVAREAEFMESNECPDSEDVVTNGRALRRKPQYSLIYLILSGECTGTCPDDPSEEIPTVNGRRNLINGQNKKQLLLNKLSEILPEITDVELEVAGNKIDCSLDATCINNALCCGVDDCSCLVEELVLCKEEYQCKHTEFPSCMNDFSCDNSITITSDHQTLAIGAGFREVGPSVQVYDRSDSGRWYQRGQDITDPTSGTGRHMARARSSGFVSKGDRFGSSVSISENGMRVAIGSYLDNFVAIFDYISKAEEWELNGVIEGPQESMFGISIDLSSEGNIVAVGAPLDDYNQNIDAGSVFIYNYSNDLNLWVTTGKNNPIRSPEMDQERFGWKVGLSEDGNVISIQARYGSDPKTFARNNKNRWKANDSLDSLIYECDRGSQTNDQCDQVL